MTYFTRRGKSLLITENAEDYKLVDIGAWELTNGAEHIGIVTNIGQTESIGTWVEDVMFAWTIKDSYRFFDTKELHSRPDY